jgi:type VI secretion system protein ImpL
MIWRILLFELVLLIVIAGVWLLAPLVGIKSVLWRVVIICLLVLPPIIIVIVKFILSRRRSNNLANAMQAQGIDQEKKARPDHQAEIGELNQNFAKALVALKKSRLGGGRGNALYALPWYMIIGPPSVGKSTALLRSGLRFPFTPGERRSIRGVGGTRNCDWWFSDQAIILDTAGRYSTEDEDQNEWSAFLQMIRKYRKKQPLNGLLVAVSVGDLLTAKPDELDDLAHQVRTRVDQVIADLELSLPVYLLFTKCDLIAGFVEFFGNLRKSQRSQVLGFTMSQEGSQADIDQLFTDEFDTLLQRVKKHGLLRLSSARPEERKSAFQFPLQFESIREPLQSFVSIMLNPNPYQDSPRLRGVYFCSGTQEGRPIDRVISMMSRGLGLRELGAANPFNEQAQKKSYFLRDVFTQVLVPDRELAGRSESSIRRRNRLQAAALASGILLSAGAVGLTTVVYSNNAHLLSDTVHLAKKSRITVPEDPRKVSASLKALEKLGRRVDTLRKYKKSGVPYSLALGFYQGHKIFKPTQRLYIKRSRSAFVLPSGSELEAELNDIAHSGQVKVKGAARDFDLLKAYLMVTNPKRLKVEFASNILLEQWKKRLHPEVAQDAAILESNSVRYLKLIKSRLATWLDRDRNLIQNVRHALRARDAEYCRVIGCDDLKRFRPFTLRDALRGRVQTILEGKYTVPGVYTRMGWSSYVRKRLAARMVSGSKIEPWVLGERATQDFNARLRKRYFDQYIAAWMKFLKGISIRLPLTAKDSLRTLDTLTDAPAPYKDLLESIAYNTRLPLVEMAAGGKAAKVAGQELLRSRAGRRLRRGASIGRRLDADKALAERMKNFDTPVLRHFRPLIELVQPPKAHGGRSQLGGLAQYLSELSAVRDALSNSMNKTEGAPRDPSKSVPAVVTEARRVTKGVLATLPGELRRRLDPLLNRPLNAASGNAVAFASKQAGKSFSNNLCAAYNQTLSGKYPFGKKRQDALLEDVIDFFGPKGTVWSYYETNLKHMLVRQGNRFKVLPDQKVPAGVKSFINRAWKVTRQLFPIGSQTPSLRFEVRPLAPILRTDVGHQISQVVFEVEGKSRTYRMGPTEQWTFEWKGQTGKRSRLMIRGANGLREEVTYVGNWGLMRLIDKGKKKRHGSWTRVTWSFRKGEIKIPIDFRPSRSQNPLFRRMRIYCK